MALREIRPIAEALMAETVVSVCVAKSAALEDHGATRVPFSPSQLFSRRATRNVILLALVCVGIQGTGTFAQSAAPVQSKFLQLGEAERFFFYEGSFRTLAVLVSTEDQNKGRCIADFYTGNRDARRRQIEDALRKAPDVAETTVIIALLEKACGKPLIPHSKR